MWVRSRSDPPTARFNVENKQRRTENLVFHMFLEFLGGFGSFLARFREGVASWPRGQRLRGGARLGGVAQAHGPRGWGLDS